MRDLKPSSEKAPAETKSHIVPLHYNGACRLNKTLPCTITHSSRDSNPLLIHYTLLASIPNFETVTDLRDLHEKIKHCTASQMKGFIAFLLCLAFANGHILHTEYEQQWQAWKTFYEKKYSTDTEEEARYAIWRDNLRVS